MVPLDSFIYSTLVIRVGPPARNVLQLALWDVGQQQGQQEEGKVQRKALGRKDQLQHVKYALSGFFLFLCRFPLDGFESRVGHFEEAPVTLQLFIRLLPRSRESQV